VALKVWEQTRSDDQAPAMADPHTEPKPAAKDASCD
jgi:hypothetical protein